MKSICGFSNTFRQDYLKIYKLVRDSHDKSFDIVRNILLLDQFKDFKNLFLRDCHKTLYDKESKIIVDVDEKLSHNHDVIGKLLAQQKKKDHEQKCLKKLNKKISKGGKN